MIPALYTRAKTNSSPHSNSKFHCCKVENCWDMALLPIVYGLNHGEREQGQKYSADDYQEHAQITSLDRGYVTQTIKLTIRLIANPFLQKFLPITRGRDRNINFICILTMPIKFIPRPRIVKNKPHHNSRLKIQKIYILRCEGRVNNPRDCSAAPAPGNRVANRRQRKQCCCQQK